MILVLAQQSDVLRWNTLRHRFARLFQIRLLRGNPLFLLIRGADRVLCDEDRGVVVRLGLTLLVISDRNFRMRLTLRGSVDLGLGFGLRFLRIRFLDASVNCRCPRGLGLVLLVLDIFRAIVCGNVRGWIGRLIVSRFGIGIMLGGVAFSGGRVIRVSLDILQRRLLIVLRGLDRGRAVVRASESATRCSFAS